MEGILGAINILDQPGFFTLTFHDENDTTGHTWTLEQRRQYQWHRWAWRPCAERRDRDDDLPAGRPELANDDRRRQRRQHVRREQYDQPGGHDLDTAGDDTVNVFATGTLIDRPATIPSTCSPPGRVRSISTARPGQDAVTLGASNSAPLGMQGLNGTINVDNSAGFHGPDAGRLAGYDRPTASMTETARAGPSPGSRRPHQLHRRRHEQPDRQTAVRAATHSRSRYPSRFGLRAHPDDSQHRYGRRCDQRPGDQCRGLRLAIHGQAGRTRSSSGTPAAWRTSWVRSRSTTPADSRA